MLWLISSTLVATITHPVHCPDRHRSQHGLGDADTIATIIGLITPVLVWAIPNKKVA